MCYRLILLFRFVTKQKVIVLYLIILWKKGAVMRFIVTKTNKHSLQHMTSFLGSFSGLKREADKAN